MTSMQELRLRTAAAGRNALRAFRLPASWQVGVYPADWGPALAPSQVRRAFAGSPRSAPIAVAARGARSAVIVVDDFRRPTPVESLCLEVLEQLEQAGVSRRQVTIITGGGAHRPQPRLERRRLGAALEGLGAWFIHDAFSPAVRYVGLTSGGTPVLVNEVAAQADFKVGISSVYPHPLTAWGGGAKIILPGICHVSSLHHHHGKLPGRARGSDPGRCPSRRDLEEASVLFGLDRAVCAVIGGSRQLCGLAVDEPCRAHRRAVALARKAFRTTMPEERPDLVIANAYPIDGDPTQLSKSAWPGPHYGVPMIQIFDFADPSPYHGLYHGRLRDFNADRRQQAYRQDPARLATARQILFSPQYGRRFVPLGETHYVENDWERLMAGLAARLPAAARVAVFPAAALQLPADPPPPSVTRR